MAAAHDHFETIMAEIRSLREEVREYRREDKSERVALASQVSELVAWRNKQAGALALVAALASVFGAAVVKLVTWMLTARGGGGA